MKRAIISDIHGNLEALKAVLDDIKAKGVSDIICLGDIIGYGPNPRECLKLIQDCGSVCIKGNHEEAVLYIGINFNVEAGLAVDWTRNEINSVKYDPVETEMMWNFIGELPRLHEEDDFLYVHASPKEPVREYLRPSDVTNAEKMQDNFNLVRHKCFCGHTHEPGAFVQYTDESVSFYRPADIKSVYNLDENKCIINAGSVGQPRDNDNRACYVIMEDNKVSFHRLAYNYKETMKKILDTKVLPKMLAVRLHAGK
jgi:predicted phosphodiesterase